MRKGKTKAEVDMGRREVRRRKEACEEANICRECRKAKVHPTQEYQHQQGPAHRTPSGEAKENELCTEIIMMKLALSSEADFEGQF